MRAKHDAETSEDDVVTVLVLLSDAYPSRVELKRCKIAEHVFELNERKVKIYNLGFQDSLDAIALVSFVSCRKELRIFTLPLRLDEWGNINANRSRQRLC